MNVNKECFHFILSLVLQGSDLANEVVTLKNQIAELEDEKGNLQLKLLDMDEMRYVHGEYSYFLYSACSMIIWLVVLEQQ